MKKVFEHVERFQAESTNANEAIIWTEDEARVIEELKERLK